MADAPRQFVRSGPLFDDGFSLIPNAVLRERRYSGLAKVAWALLYDYSYRAVEPELTEFAGRPRRRNQGRTEGAEGADGRRQHRQPPARPRPAKPVRAARAGAVPERPHRPFKKGL
jgi:hypothetical protein